MFGNILKNNMKNNSQDIQDKGRISKIRVKCNFTRVFRKPRGVCREEYGGLPIRTVYGPNGQPVIFPSALLPGLKGLRKYIYNK